MKKQETEQFTASGGLNLDDDKSKLPKGDYLYALNMIYQAGPEGQADAIKKMGGLQQLLADYESPFTYDGDLVVVDMTIDYENKKIYILARDDSYAWVWEYFLDYNLVVAPSNLEATGISEVQINLSWVDNSDNESGFEIWRSIEGGPFSLLNTVDGGVTTYNDLAVLAGVTYSYKVRGTGTDSVSNFSNVASETTPFYPPTELDANPASETSIYMSWVDNSASETGYEIWRSFTGGGVGYSKIATVFDATEFTDSDGLSPDTTYWYKVRAINALAESDFTDEVSAKTFNAFVSVWKTDNLGTSANNQITLPLVSTGTYGMIVAWGDGKRDVISAYNQSEVTHTYDATGTYEVKIYGELTGWAFNNSGDRQKILEISKWGDFKPGDQDACFYGCINLDVTATDTIDLTTTTTLGQFFQNCSSLVYNSTINNWDVSNITLMGNLFRGCVLFDQDLSEWDVSNVTSFDSIFYGCSIFNQDIGEWDVSSCSVFSNMFRNCIVFNQDIGGWTTSLATNMFGMFYNAEQFNQDVSGFDMSDVTTIEAMFREASSFNSSVSWSDTSSLLSIAAVFYDASDFNQPLSTWDTTLVTAAGEAFRGATSFNQDLSAWDVANLQLAGNMFRGATSFNGNIDGWDTGNVTNMLGMFNGTTSFNRDISMWDTGSVIDMNSMFFNAIAFNQDLGGWNIENVADAANMLAGVTLSIANYNSLLTGWEAQSVQNNVVFNGGNSEYSSGSAAATARAALIADHSWIITDGGAI